MATNQTTNYQLNQWETTDQVLRTDFNADNAKLDTALQNQADNLTALTGQVEEEIASLTASVATNTAALNGKGNCQLYTTSYVGTGQSARSISLPGTACFVMVMGPSTCLWGVRGSSFGMSINFMGQGNNISFSWSGTTVSWNTNNYDSACNTSGTTYSLLALIQK